MKPRFESLVLKFFYFVLEFVLNVTQMNLNYLFACMNLKAVFREKVQNPRRKCAGISADIFCIELL